MIDDLVIFEGRLGYLRLEEEVRKLHSLKEVITWIEKEIGIYLPDSILFDLLIPRIKQVLRENKNV